MFYLFRCFVSSAMVIMSRSSSSPSMEVLPSNPNPSLNPHAIPYFSLSQEIYFRQQPPAMADPVACGVPCFPQRLVCDQPPTVVWPYPAVDVWCYNALRQPLTASLAAFHVGHALKGPVYYNANTQPVSRKLGPFMPVRDFEKEKEQVRCRRVVAPRLRNKSKNNNWVSRNERQWVPKDCPVKPSDRQSKPDESGGSTSGCGGGGSVLFSPLLTGGEDGKTSMMIRNIPNHLQ